jgi:hypothetical protein
MEILPLHIMRSLAFPFLVVLSFILLPRSSVADNLAKLLEGETAYNKAMEKACTDYRKVLAEELGEATKVEVFLLDFDDKKYSKAIENNWDARMEEDVFPIIPFKSATGILKRKILTPSQSVTLIAALQETLSTPKKEPVAICHFPIHGIRVWVYDRLLFQTSLCWHCGNFYVKYPDETASWLSIENPDLQRIVNNYLPIPNTELERFKKADHPFDLGGK